MFKIFVFCQIVFFFLLTLINHTSGAYFDYHHQDNWYDDYKDCSLKKQSPIEIYTVESVSDKSLPAIVMKNYELRYKDSMKLENNGHSANILFPNPKNLKISWQAHDRLSPSVSGGLLGGNSFIAENLHFHWGSRNYHGSEHFLDGQKFAMEMHIVHRNGKYQTLDIAKNHPDGIAVLAVFFKVDKSSCRSHTGTDNMVEGLPSKGSSCHGYAGINNIVEALPYITKYDSSVVLKDFSLKNLLADLKTSEYFTYAGSLTTPPCSEAVTWTIFTNPIYISSEQMAAFRRIHDPKGNILQNNYRNLQPKFFRKVYIVKKQ